MGYARRIAAASVVLLIQLIFLSQAPAIAGEQVSFRSAPIQPTPFKLKQARKQGIELEPEPGVLLTAELSKPGGSGPFPAVVLLHGCRGIQPYQRQWARELVSWGYVTLLVDSYGPRNIKQTCTNIVEAFYQGVYLAQARDAFGALVYLQSRSFVEAGRTAVMGWARDAVLGTVVKLGEQAYSEQKFRAAVALYPLCKDLLSGDLVAPVLVLIGAMDDWTPAPYCEHLAKVARESGQAVVLKVYPETYHAFDDPSVGKLWNFDSAQNIEKTPARGATLGYSATAHEDAKERVRMFLAKHLR